MSSGVLCTGWALGMINNKVSIPSLDRLQANTVARRVGHEHSLKSAFREEQGLTNSKLLNNADC